MWLETKEAAVPLRRAFASQWTDGQRDAEETGVTGIILVIGGKITVRVVDADGRGTTTAEYPQLTIEDLADAARVLGNWMNVKSENRTRHHA